MPRYNVKKYQSFFENSADAMLIIENDVFVDCNSATVTMLGYDRKEEIINTHPFDLSPEFQPDGRSSFEKAAEMIRRAKEKGSHQFEWDHLRKDGSVIPVEVSLTATKTGKDALLHTVWRDLTPRKNMERALRESEEKYRQLADSMPDLVWSADSTGKVDYYNKRRSEFKGFSQKPDGSWEWIPVLHPDDIQKTVDAWNRALRSAETYQIEHRVQRADGSIGWFLSRAVPSRNEQGQVTKWFGTTTDIDELKKAEIALDEAKQLAEEANRIKSEFLANMSHEIRTPVTAIISALEHLLDIEEEPEHLKVLELAELASKRLHELIEDVLTVSKIEARKVEIVKNKFVLKDEVKHIVDIMATKANNKKIAIHLRIAPDVPDEILGDRYRIGQVLTNLVDNAIKFTEAGEVRLDVETTESDLLFKIKDTGIGIPDKMFATIFDNFTQVDGSITRKHGGTGLGLAISKTLAELMGGEILVESALGRGSLFTFKLPLP